MNGSTTSLRCHANSISKLDEKTKTAYTSCECDVGFVLLQDKQAQKCVVHVQR